MREGVVIVAGALAMSSQPSSWYGSPTKPRHATLSETDVYWTSGAWATFLIRPYGLPEAQGRLKAAEGSVMRFRTTVDLNGTNVATGIVSHPRSSRRSRRGKRRIARSIDALREGRIR